MTCEDVFNYLQTLPYVHEFDATFHHPTISNSNRTNNNRIDRIVFTVDSNDAGGTCQQKFLNIMGFELKVPSSDRLYTCCEDHNYQYTGDISLIHIHRVENIQRGKLN